MMQQYAGLRSGMYLAADLAQQLPCSEEGRVAGLQLGHRLARPLLELVVLIKALLRLSVASKVHSTQQRTQTRLDSKSGTVVQRRADFPASPVCRCLARQA